jgi:RHS repeat-associated protein
MFIDVDGSSATGCEVSTVDGPFSGAERLVVTELREEGGGSWLVGPIQVQTCSGNGGGSFGPSTTVDPGGWPVGLGNGVGSSDVVEVFWVVVGDVAAARFGFEIEDPTGSRDALLESGRTPAPIPALSGIGVLVCIILFLVALAYRSRGAQRAVGLLLLALALPAFAAVVFDGEVDDWVGVPPSRFDQPGDATLNGSDLRAYFVAPPMGGRQPIRVDVDLASGNAPETPTPTHSATPSPTFTPSSSNNPPQVISEPVTTAGTRRFYRYPVEVYDPDFEDVIASSLTIAPEGMTIDSETGAIEWKPTEDQVGEHAVTVRVEDAGGLFDTQQYVVSVEHGPNRPPIITSDPPTEVILLAESTDLLPVDLRSWTYVQSTASTGQPPANWLVDASGTSVTQTVNANASFFLSDFDLANDEIEGSWRVDTGDDDDFMGFVFGYQDPTHFYLFDWKQADQQDCGTGLRGMSVKIVNADSALQCADLWNTNGTADRVETLFHNSIPYADRTDYEFFLRFEPGMFTITVKGGDIVIESVTLSDSTYTSGKFGFYNFSQSSVRYSGFQRRSLKQGTYVYDAEAVDPDADPLTFSLSESPAGMTIDPVTGLVQWEATGLDIGEHEVTIRVEDGRGGFDEQTFVLTVKEANNPPQITSQPRLLVSCEPQCFYFNDFEDESDPLDEWSISRTDVTPVGARRFLGQFGNETASLTLTNLPPHSRVTVSLDLYNILTWDGNQEEAFGATVGPDLWSLSVDGQEQLRTTFSNHVGCNGVAFDQAYPEPYPGGSHRGQTGATSTNSLGYASQGCPYSSVYRLSFPIEHSGSSLTLNFSAAGLQDLTDESWGLDNVCVRLENESQFEATLKYVGLSGQDVVATPMVANLTDDNGDGRIDLADIPDIVLPTIPISQFLGGPIKAIRGDTGEEIFTTPAAHLVGTLSDIALGDIDGDGIVEIVAPHANGQQLVAFENDGSLKWLSDADVLPGRMDAGGAISFADLDQDGVPEIIVGASVYSADGRLLADGRDLGGTVAFNLYTAISAVADIDLDGVPEIVAGPTAYRFDGTNLSIVWQRGDRHDGFVGIGNFDADPEAEVLIVGLGSLYLLNHDGSDVELWNPQGGNAPVSIPGGGAGGAPTIADVDGDNELEIGVAGASRYVVFNSDGSVLWQKPTQDTSFVTGSTAFDFTGDGTSEIVYRDELKLRIYNGVDGTILLETPVRSDTGTELPTIADVDNDGEAELIVTSGQSVSAGAGTSNGDEGVYVFESSSGGWASTRRIWNQHSYHITNVNEDGSIPQMEEPNWLVPELNNFRLNTFGPGDESFCRQDRLVGITSVGELISINPGTGSGRLTAATGLAGVDALEVDEDGALLAIANTSDLYRIDPETGAAERIGNTGVVFVESLAFANGVLYGGASLDGDIQAETLISIDPKTGASTVLGPFGVGIDIDALAPGPDGQLLAADLQNLRFFKIDPQSLATTIIATLPERITALDLAGNGTTYATSVPGILGGPSNLYRIDVATGDATIVGATGFDTVAGVVFVEGNCDTRSYRYDAEAFDPDGDELTFSLSKKPAGMQVNPSTGVVSWNPTRDQRGSIPVTLKVDDGRGGSDEQSFELFVPVDDDCDGYSPEDGDCDDTDPSINPAATEIPGNGIDEDCDGLDDTSPLDIDDDGDGFTERQGDCDDADPARFPGAVDVPGNGIDEDCSGSDATPPPSSVEVRPATAEVLEGQTQQFSATATFPDGSTRDVTATSTWESDAPGIASVNSAGLALGISDGIAGILARVDGVEGRADLTVVARVIDDVFPEVAITSPAVDTDIKTPTDIIGTANDANFLRYELLLLDTEANVLREIGAGRAPVVNGILGTLDPTLLPNGVYHVLLRAFDRGGNSNTAETRYSVSGNLKLGNFRLSFTDLSIPVAGIPLSIIRTYDSLDTSPGDFGAGWRLGYPGQVVDSARENPFEGFTDRTKVYVTKPDGQRVGFSFAARCGFFGCSPALAADPGVFDTLTVPDTLLFREGDGKYNQFGRPYNPSRYVLTTKEKVEYTIDEVEGLLRVVDANGNSLEFTDAGVESSTGVSLAFERDAAGRITKVIEPDDDPDDGEPPAFLEYVYDEAGNLLSFFDQMRHETKYFYEDGRFPHYLTRILDPLGRATVRSVFNDAGQLIGLCDANGDPATLVGCAQLSPDSSTQQQTIVNARGFRTDLFLDSRGNVLRELRWLDGARFLETRRTYDSDGNQLTETDPEGNVKSWTYDQWGNQLTRTEGGRTTAFTYNDCNQVLTEQDPAGNVARRDYDSTGCLVRFVTDALSNVAEYRYNAAGQVTDMIEANGTHWQWTYDSGFPDTITDPLGNTATFDFSAAGELRALIDRKGQRIDFLYDAADRLLTETWDTTPPRVTTYDYNGAGQLTGVVDPDSALVLTYDVLGRLQSVDNDGTPGALRAVVSYGYDANGNVNSVTDSLGGDTRYHYDGLDRLVRVEQSGTNVQEKRVDLVYDDASLPRELHRFSDLAATQGVANTFYGYDCGGCAGRLAGIHHHKAFDGAIIHDLDFVRDSLGNIAQMSDVDGIHGYSYDQVRRLKTASHPPGPQPGESYTYDAVGNRLSSHLSTSYSYLANSNRLVEDDQISYQYDEIGSLIERTDRSTGEKHEFFYDHRNRLMGIVIRRGDGTEVSRATYVYDAANRRIRAEEGGIVTTFVYDGLNPMLAGSGPFARRRLYGRATDAIFADEVNGETRWSLVDQVGSVRDLIGDDANRVMHYVYDSFGRVVAQSGATTPNELSYTGREFGQTSGLGYFRARFYDPRLGRFLQEDPVSMFRYDYVGNMPLTSTDPSGGAAIADALLLFGIIETAACVVERASLDPELRSLGQTLCLIPYTPGISKVPTLTGSATDATTVQVLGTAGIFHGVVRDVNAALSPP